MRVEIACDSCDWRAEQDTLGKMLTAFESHECAPPKKKK